MRFEQFIRALLIAVSVLILWEWAIVATAKVIEGNGWTGKRALWSLLSTVVIAGYITRAVYRDGTR